MGVNNITEEGIKDTEIGLLPASWEITDIGSLFSIQQGKALSKKHRQGKSPYPFLRTSNVLWSRLDLSTLDEMDFTDAERERYELEVGDLLICEGGEIGRTAIWNNEIENCYMQNHVFRVRAKSQEIYPQFYMYWMQTALTILNLYQGYGNKTTIPNLSKTRLSSFPVPLAPLPEQKNIAYVLTTIQEAIEVQERVINAARELKRSLMHRLFTYGPYEEECPTKETEIGEVPTEWEVKPLGELVEIQYGAQAAVANNTDPSIGTPILTNTNIKLEGGLDLSLLRYYKVPDKKRNQLILNKGDILFNWRSGSPNHVGKTAIFNLSGEYTHSSFILRFRPKGSVNNNYLAHYLGWLKERNFFAQRRSQSSVNSVFNKNASKEIPVILPSEEEQEEIATKLDAADSKIALEVSRRTALEILFKSLLHQLMTGQIRVSDMGLKENE